MKLTWAQIERTLSQFEAEAIPESHPVLPRLNELFGDHTFFIDSNGLNIVEPTHEPAAGRTQAARVVNVADWSDETQSGLAAHDPSRLTPLSNLSPNTDPGRFSVVASEPPHHTSSTSTTLSGRWRS
jgi:hypothetical protein